MMLLTEYNGELNRPGKIIPYGFCNTLILHLIYLKNTVLRPPT